MADPRWLVDSSGWIEYFTDGPNANAFAEAIESPQVLVVPSLSLLEVYRWMLRRHGEGPAIQAIALMRQGQEIPHQAILLSQDADFQGIPGVQFIAKRPTP